MGRRRQKFKFSVPFYDRGRPNPPYVKGSRWVIQAHDAPPPFGHGYKTLHRRGPNALRKMRKEQLPQSVYCMLNPPPGPEPPEAALRLEIEVTEELRVHTAQGAQVVSCRIVKRSDCTRSRGSDFDAGQSSADRELVAKIFDPLYYYYNGEFDIVDLADMEYSREAAAYAHLQRQGVGGQLLPAFAGSYTLELPLGEEQRGMLAPYACSGENHTPFPTTRRRVRLILTERARGQSMTYQLVFGDVHAIPRSIRMDAVASVMEAYARLYFHGIVHGDLAPRNVFLRETRGDDDRCLSPGETMKAKKLLFSHFVDLGLAYILGESISKFPRQPAFETLPRNPIRLFWHVFDSGAANMHDWLPEEVRNTNTFQRWMLRRWYSDTRFESIGAMPEPSADDVLWDTGKADKNCHWPGDRTPDDEPKAENLTVQEATGTDRSLMAYPPGFW